MLFQDDDDEGMEAEFEGVIHGVIDSEKAVAEQRAKKSYRTKECRCLLATERTQQVL